MEHRVNSLTESGILSAVTVLMALIGVYVPFLGLVAILLWPLPITVLVVRHGFRWGVMAAVVASVLIAVIIEPTVAVRLALAFAPVGLALGYGYRLGWSGIRLVTAAIVVSVLAKGIALMMVFFLTGIHPFSGQLEMLRESYTQAVEMYKGMGMNEVQIEMAKQSFEHNLGVIEILLPLVVVTMGLLDTMVNFIVAGKVFKRLGMEVPVLPPFREWRLPQAFAWLFGASLVAAYIGHANEIPILFQAGMNGYMAATLAGLVEGVVVFEYAMAHYNWSRWASTIFLIMIFMNGLLFQILAIAGILDTVFDYRKKFFGAER